MRQESFQLQTAAVATGNGATAATINKCSRFSLYIEGGASASGTVVCEAQSPAGNWAQVNSTAISSATPVLVQFTGTFRALRARISVYAAGTFNVYLDAAGDN